MSEAVQQSLNQVCSLEHTRLGISDHAFLTAEDQAFNKLKDSVAIQIFKIQTNVQGIQRLVDKLGTAQDGPSLRKSL